MHFLITLQYIIVTHNFMNDSKIKIKSALISVYHKDNIEEIIKKLHSLDVTIYSTGGTYDYISSLGIPVTAVEDITGYPSVFGGRVKTLHPKVFGGILYRRSNKTDIEEAAKFDIPPIDLVIVDLYPFEQTVASAAAHEDIIEKIDIGGISLIRASAKNYTDVIIVPSVASYLPLLQLLEEGNGFSTLEQRLSFAGEAFRISSNYDTAIYNYFNGNKGIVNAIDYSHSHEMRYGENPHQAGVFYGDLSNVFEQLHGKSVSYNNLVDIDSALLLVSEFDDPACVIIKHTNACGAAVRGNIADAYKAALEGDPVSAYGGVIAVNRKIDEKTAEIMNSLFFEILMAPEFEKNALTILQSKKNRILLQIKHTDFQKRQFKSILNGVLEQDCDRKTETSADLKQVTKKFPDDQQVKDLLFANILVKHLKSNAIVLARDNQLLGMGCGMTSRVDALKHAIAKAAEFNLDLEGSVMASDAFFPFADSVEIAHKAGIKAVIEPGGSVRDEDSINYCNEHEIPMVFTGTRHFKH